MPGFIGTVALSKSRFTKACAWDEEALKNTASEKERKRTEVFICLTGIDCFHDALASPRKKVDNLAPPLVDPKYYRLQGAIKPRRPKKKIEAAMRHRPAVDPRQSKRI